MYIITVIPLFIANVPLDFSTKTTATDLFTNFLLLTIDSLGMARHGFMLKLKRHRQVCVDMFTCSDLRAISLLTIPKEMPTLSALGHRIPDPSEFFSISDGSDCILAMKILITHN